MYRKILEKLVAWKTSPYRKPLIIQGARQIGKTYSIMEFGRLHYENIAYFNFETSTSLQDIFNGDLIPEQIIAMLSRRYGTAISKQTTLIVFDEIQLCERALTSLKYFCELAPDFHIIAAGSLLGVAVNRQTFSFPVGKVDMLTMHPMDMEEFLLALDEKYLIQEIHQCFDNNTPIHPELHRQAMNYYRQYLLIGGMPACVQLFVDTKDYVYVRHVQDTILTAYLNDMSKYNTNTDTKKTRMIYNSITVQLSKENTKFQYKLVKKSGRASEFEGAIDWLNLSGLVDILPRVNTPSKPLNDFIDLSAFKAYISDVGLLCAKKEIVVNDILLDTGELNHFKSGLTENYVNTQLKSLGYQTYYYAKDNEIEIDFLIQREGHIIPVEVKSAEHSRARSLDAYIRKFQPKYAIKICGRNFGFENGMRTVPLYAVSCLSRQY